MSTVADLPPSSKRLTGPSKAWQGFQDSSSREDTHTWLVKYSESNAFYDVVVGQTTTITYGTGANGAPQPSITRRIPLQHPDNSSMYATKLNFRGIDGIGKVAGDPYAWVEIAVGFGYLGYNVTSDTSQGGDNTQTSYPPFMKISGKPSNRLVTDTSKKYTYKNPNGTTQQTTQGVLNQNVAIPCGGTSYHIELFCIPDLAAWQTLMDPLKGTVNSQDFAIGSFNQPAGTSFLEGYGFEVEQDVMGNYRWTGTIDITTSSLPWNSIVVGGTQCQLSPPICPSADHNTLYY